MKYITVITDYAPKTERMAACVEEKANEMAEKGYELVSFSITNTSRAILVFRLRSDSASIAGVQE